MPSADPSHLVILQRPQQFDLGLRRHFRHLVEEQRTAVRAFEAAGARHGAGKGADLGAEQLALHQRHGNGAAVDRHERRRRPMRQPMNAARHQLLAGAALAHHHYRGIRVRERLHQLAHLHQCRRLAHQPVRRRAALAGAAGGAVHQRVVQLGQQRAQLVGLEQVVAGAGTDRVHRHRHLGDAGQDHHRRAERQAADVAQEIQAVAVREGDVQEHDLHITGGGQPPAIGQGGGGQQFVLVRQHQFERTVGARVVVDQ